MANFKSPILDKKAQEDESQAMVAAEKKTADDLRRRIQEAEVAKAENEAKLSEAKVEETKNKSRFIDTDRMGKGLENFASKIGLLDKDAKKAEEEFKKAREENSSGEQGVIESIEERTKRIEDSRNSSRGPAGIKTMEGTGGGDPRSESGGGRRSRFETMGDSLSEQELLDLGLTPEKLEQLSKDGDSMKQIISDRLKEVGGSLPGEASRGPASVGSAEHIGQGAVPISKEDMTPPPEDPKTLGSGQGNIIQNLRSNINSGERLTEGLNLHRKNQAARDAIFNKDPGAMTNDEIAQMEDSKRAGLDVGLDSKSQASRIPGIGASFLKGAKELMGMGQETSDPVEMPKDLTGYSPKEALQWAKDRKYKPNDPKLKTVPTPGHETPMEVLKKEGADLGLKALAKAYPSLAPVISAFQKNSQNVGLESLTKDPYKGVGTPELPEDVLIPSEEELMGDLEGQQLEVGERRDLITDIKKSKIQMNEINKNYDAYIETHREERAKSVKNYEETKQKLIKARRESPSYKEAISKIPAGNKVLAVLSATFAGAAGSSNPLAIVDSLIEQSYTDEKTKHESRIAAIDDENSLLKEVMQFEKEDHVAELLYYNESRRQVMEQLKFQEQAATTEQQINTTKDLQQKLDMQIQETEQEIQQWGYDKGKARADDIFVNKLKQKEFELDKIGKGLDQEHKRFDAGKILRDEAQSRFDKKHAAKMKEKDLDLRIQGENRLTKKTNADILSLQQGDRRQNIESAANVKYKGALTKKALTEAMAPRAGSNPLEIYLGKTPYVAATKKSAEYLRKTAPETILHLRGSAKALKIYRGEADTSKMDKSEKNFAKAIKDYKNDPYFSRLFKKKVGDVLQFAGKESEYYSVTSQLFADVTGVVLQNRTHATGGGQLSDAEKQLLYQIAGVQPPKDAKDFDVNVVMEGIMRSLVGGSLQAVLESTMKKNANRFKIEIQTHSGTRLNNAQSQAIATEWIQGDDG